VVIYDEKKELDTVIEIKRYGSSWSEIFEDVKRLSILKRDRKNKKFYELIISDKKVPKEFVNANTGRAIVKQVHVSRTKFGKNKTNEESVCCSVVRVCSLSSCKLSEKNLISKPLVAGQKLFRHAYFACLLEVAPAAE